MTVPSYGPYGLDGFYDRQGRRITGEQCVRLLEAERDVAETRLPNGLRVVTEWTGYPIAGAGPYGLPQIFRSLVLDDEGAEVAVASYECEGAARTGHAELVEIWRAWRRPGAPDDPEASGGPAKRPRRIIEGDLPD